MPGSALSAIQAGHYEEAVRMIEDAYPQGVSLGAPDLVPSYVKALVELAGTVKKDDPERAKSFLERAITLAPQNADAHFQLGLVQNAANAREEALNAFREAVRLDPSFADAHYNLGLALHQNKQYPEAITHYQKTIELNRAFFNAYFNLGNLYAEQQEWAKAEALFTQVVELAPPYLDEAYFNLAVVQDMQGKKEDSIKNLEQSLMVKPDNQKAKEYLENLTEVKK
jgi:tetratricopeptide (TPR) repeat protein